MLYLYWVKSYYRKTFIAKTANFFSFCCSLEAKPLILDQIWGHNNERALKELSNALFRSTVALLVPELCANLSKIGLLIMLKIGQIRHLMTSGLWWPELWHDLKNDRNSFVVIFDALSNAAYRVSVRGPGAELEGGLQNTPSSIGGGKFRRPAGRGLIMLPL